MSIPGFPELRWLEEKYKAHLYEADGLDYPIAEFSHGGGGRVRVIFRTRTQIIPLNKHGDALTLRPDRAARLEDTHTTFLMVDLPSAPFQARLKLSRPLRSWIPGFGRISVDTTSQWTCNSWLTDSVERTLTRLPIDQIDVAADVMVIEMAGRYYSRRELGGILLHGMDIIRSVCDAKARSRQEWVRSLQSAARRFDGVIDSEDPSVYPRLVFNSQRRDALIEFQPAQELSSDQLPACIKSEYQYEARTTFTAQVPGAANLKLKPRSSRWGFILYGSEDFKIGDPKFDSRFSIRTRSRESAVRLLNTECRRYILSLLDMPGESPIFDISGGVLSITKPCCLRAPSDELDRFTELCRGVLSACGHEARVLEVIQAGEGDCPVCLAPLSEDIRKCAKCRTPVHRECWAYLGRCPTFACGTSRSTLR
jgi:hypothetical protein